MSAEITNLVWESSKSHGVERLVMLALAKLCPRRYAPFLVTASYEDVAALANISSRHIKRLLAEMVAKEDEITVFHAGKGRSVKTIYQLHFYSKRSKMKPAKRGQPCHHKTGHQVSPFIVVPSEVA